MELMTYYMEKNPCYSKPKIMTPKGIVVHDTSAGNPYISRYVGPDDGILGPNRYGNDWNKPTANKMVHAFIGYDKDNNVRTYNVLPWTYQCWGCGGGSKGSYNNTHIQFEICDDKYLSSEYFGKVWTEAVDLCAFLCDKFSLPVESVVSHKEAHKAGYASDHSDTSVWFSKYAKTMDDFRAAVSKKMEKAVTVNADTYLLYGAGSRARKLAYLYEGTPVELTGTEKNGYKRAKIRVEYVGYIKNDFLSGGSDK